MYQTTCQATGKIYVGVHSTDNLNDGYIGSGKELIADIKRLGLHCFTREILSLHPTRKAALVAEAAIVTEEWVQRPSTYNLIVGGSATPFSSGRRKFSDAHRRKLSEARKKQIIHPRSQETRQKIAAAKRGKPRPDFAAWARLPRGPRGPQTASHRETRLAACRKFWQTDRGIALRKEASERMKTNNPRHR